ncbi:hypothetical protein DND01_22020 [Escherichia albertii]|nr:hypothetical protein [Escherichia albertii]
MEFYRTYGIWHCIQGVQTELLRIERNSDNCSWINLDSRKIDDEKLMRAFQSQIGEMTLNRFEINKNIEN